MIEEILENINNILKYPVELSKTLEIEGGYLVELKMMDLKDKFFCYPDTIEEDTLKSVFSLLKKKIDSSNLTKTTSLDSINEEPKKEGNINQNLKKYFKEGKNFKKQIEHFYNDLYNIHHYIDKKSIVISDKQGKLLKTLQNEDYNTENLLQWFRDIPSLDKKSDPGEINQLIMSEGYTESRFSDGFWIFKNPSSGKYIVHSEDDKNIALIDNNDKLIKKLKNQEYNTQNLMKFM